MFRRIFVLLKTSVYKMYLYDADNFCLVAIHPANSDSKSVVFLREKRA